MTRTKRIGTIVLSAAVVLALAIWIASIVLRPKFPTPAAVKIHMQQQAALSGGAQVYVTHCAYCHDVGIGPSIAGRNLPAAAIKAFVRSGPGAMQAFTPAQVSDADIDAVARYVNALVPSSAKKP